MFAKPLDKAALAATSRRTFLKGAGALGGAFVLATQLPLTGKAFAAKPGDPPAPNAFVRITPDNTVTVLIKHIDMGQGVTTGLPTIVAEELDADWGQMRFAFAPANAEVYNNLFFGPVQGTGGSTSTANSWEQLRKAGAAMRSMLVAAAAETWRVPAAAITVEKGVVRHAASGRSATFGELAAKAATMPVPAEVKLKDPREFKLIGTRLPRLDTPDKITGRGTYALDVRRPGQLTAVVAHPPRFGGRVKGIDAGEAKKVPGVIDVVEIPTGVAVVAKDTWSAIRGREALRVTWDFSAAENRSSEAIMAEYKALAAKPGLKAAARGDVGKALAGAAKVLEAEFEFPYLAHAPMEPLNGVIEPTPGGATIWTGSQFQTIEQAVVGSILGLAPEKVAITSTYAGGSFGRRATPNADYLAEAATIARATGMKAPIHLVWTREDDMKAGRYRPMVYHKVRAGLDARGRLVGWEHVIVGKSILAGTPFEGMLVKDGIDATTVEGVADMPYAVPDFLATVHNTKEGVPVLWWRSVGHTHTGHAVETFMDELAHAAGKDAVAFRLDLLAHHPRHVGVLKLAAEKAGWGEALPKGRGRGIAVHESFSSYVAMVADVTVSGGKLKVDRIVAAVDCGLAINPDVVRAQVEGAVGFALSSVLRNRVTLKDGEVQETNFDGFEPTRMSEMPKVEVHILPSAEPPTGIGEPGVPCLAPAIGNAVFAATGKRLRSLPLDLASLSGT
ncbi:xanthine dehydrogenase family protein molybdopterin-binding subunit [Chelatococcus sp. SYSU_G07232]|uniref:Xanthine dehydrogenase family protein molybdopterin-binding subunit n=1 Tax=Chelatococcus albus TaxID=3047466 RepID=A0ABT7AKA6_9HYPH|nr:xanthine dehydrogenase family protein molybdopterin-binding subunit [Chelatococcus sp. SYSU_G07232]MDJ1159799.1 xanthine dehydrogenase family protein molybdopterin-binding subunit [Chelatococcus sp. SYSU_G07232]